MFPLADTKSAAAVAVVVRSTFRQLFPHSSPEIVDQLFVDAERMFSGRYLDYQAIDLGYHDFEHTLQATLCFALIFRGRHESGVEPRLGRRHFEMGIAAALLHDTGYLRLRSDHAGTGAKYTHVHVLRSGAFAASYVPSLGFNAKEASLIAHAIHCTGPGANLTHLHFDSLGARLIGCMLVTADYLGQMAAPDYPDELETLFLEFRESDLFFNQPDGQVLFTNARSLKERTPAFWRDHVMPKLEKEFDGVYRFLADPYPEGPNAYLEAVERNMARIGSFL